jgi:hypothetical protein
VGTAGGALLVHTQQPAEAAAEPEARGNEQSADHDTAASSHDTAESDTPEHDTGEPPSHGADDAPGHGAADAHQAAPGVTGGHVAEALLLSCMDFRLMDKVGEFMAREGLSRQYDHVILAGASLVPATNAFPDWNAAFWKHLELALQLHSIRRVVVLDHRDCGAYKLMLGPDVARDRESETRAHTEHLTRLRADIRDEYPTLHVDLLLMDLDGSVERIG